MYTTGAKLNPKDNRDINIARVQAPVELPKKYITDISMLPVLNQRGIGACVGHAIAITQAFMNYKETGKVEYLSPRFIYSQAKKIDGLTTEGTYPRVGAKITTDLGCATEDLLQNDTFLTHNQYIAVNVTQELLDNAKPYKTKGYAFVPVNTESLKQAIFQNGMITITIACGDITTKEIKPGTDNGHHYIAFYGYETVGNDTIFYYRNSWGDTWGDKGNGKLSAKAFTGLMFDAIAYVDLPNQIKEEARAGYKYFKQSEIIGLEPSLVEMLDTARGIAGVPFVISSGKRSKAQNEKAGGVEDSAHLTGFAVDILCKTSDVRWKMINSLFKAGFTRIGIGKDFLHADNDPSKPKQVIWHYY